MAKLAPKDEKPFNPITDKLIQHVSAPVQRTQRPAQEEVTPRLVPAQAAFTHQAQQETGPELETGTIERLTRQMRYQATPAEEMETKDFVRRLSVAAGTSLTHSNIMRACRDLLFQVEDKLIDELSRTRLKRPINDKHAIARFEARLAEIEKK
jgi:hypothetical protein